jgi:ABC-2 type transport system permease protein
LQGRFTALELLARRFTVGTVCEVPLKVLSFLWRDWLIESGYRISFLLHWLGVLFNVLVFYFMGRLIGTAAAPALVPYGGDYFAFVLVGIALNGYFATGLGTFASNLRQAQMTGTLEAILLTPTRPSTIVIGSSLWDYLLMTLNVLVYLAMGALLGVDFSRGNYFAALVVLALSVVTFSAVGIISASVILVAKRGDPVAWALNVLLTLLGGVYYPVEILPVYLQRIAEFLPVTYALRAMRLALLQGFSLSALAREVAILFAFAVVLVPLSLLTFQFAVNLAKREGSLAQY